MDSLITAAARALAAGDPLGALRRIALREDAPALALRGTAMAQLGDLGRARALLRQAARAYGATESLARARCIVAEAEVAIACRDFGGPARALGAARATLESHGDRINAAHARYLEIRRLLLLGRLEAAEQALEQLRRDELSAPLRVIRELIVAGIAVRRVQAKAARAALGRAARAAAHAGIAALAAEVDAAGQALRAPAARLLERGRVRELDLAEVETVLESPALVVDACRFTVREPGRLIALAPRPVLFILARLLAEAWPADASREALAARAFRARRLDETYRARLRVEIGRLRRVLREVAEVVATPRGFSMVPLSAGRVAVLAPPVEEPHGAVLALLADGEAWSSSALALALDLSARTVQRSLEALAASGRVQAVGRGRARRWLSPPLPGITTALLLPAGLASG